MAESEFAAADIAKALAAMQSQLDTQRQMLDVVADGSANQQSFDRTGRTFSIGYHHYGGDGTGLPWYAVAGVGDANVTLGDGFAVYGVTTTDIGSIAVPSPPGEGTWFLCAKLDLSTGTWSLEWAEATDGTFPTAMGDVLADQLHYVAIAKVVFNATPVVTTIQQLFNQYCIYVPRLP